MFTILMILHFIALGMSLGGGMSNILAKRQMPKVDPVTYPGMAKAAEAVGKMASTGLAILWITGLWMTTIKYGWAGVPFLLWVKIAIVGSLTVVVISFNVLLIKAKKSGIPPDSEKADKHAYLINALALLTIVLAVVLFR